MILLNKNMLLLIVSTDVHLKTKEICSVKQVQLLICITLKLKKLDRKMELFSHWLAQIHRAYAFVIN